MHGAETHKAAIKDIFGFFNKTIDQCNVLVGDNGPVNEKLARIMGSVGVLREPPPELDGGYFNR